MPDVQRPRGVRAHELDLYPAAGRLGAAVGVPAFGDLTEHEVERLRGEADVDEPRPGHLGGPDRGRRRKVAHDELGDVARRPAGLRRHGERDVRRVVAVLLLARPGELHLGQVAGQPELRRRRVERPR